jgi:CPA1 family monovalent cation:H+ antiporter
MEIFDIIGILLTLAAIFGWINHRYLKLPNTIGLMLLSLGVSVVIIIVGQFVPSLMDSGREFVGAIDFNEALLNVMLSYLLFAGALHVNLSHLTEQGRLIGTLATVGVVISTFLVGTAMFYLLPLFGLKIAYIQCLLFGALISPTDPVAVLGFNNTTGAPKTLETKITGESLFNDGVGVVVFLALLGISRGEDASVAYIGKLFAVEVLGGILFGLVIGYIGFRLLKSMDNYQIEVIITLAMVTGGYSLAQHLHISGPLAMVVAGLMIGNQGRTLAMSDTTRQHLDKFWELIDEGLNAVLFVLIGLELMILEIKPTYLLVGLCAIVVTLGARLVAVSVPVKFLQRFREFSPKVIRILTWGGLRGGISVALVLSLDKGEVRDLFLTATYVVVIFSIAVQGLTLKYLFDPKPGAKGSH